MDDAFRFSVAVHSLECNPFVQRGIFGNLNDRVSQGEASWARASELQLFVIFINALIVFAISSPIIAGVEYSKLFCIIHVVPECSF
jgi:hypothetical protein